MTRQVVAGFLPSISGFRFANSFPDLPIRRVGVPGVVSLSIGDASAGLCGGMAFAVRDYFEAGRAPPNLEIPPTEGELFNYLVTRLFDSFDLPFGPRRYLELMSPLRSDGETFWSRLGLAPHGRAWVMIRDEWPKIRADLDAGYPCPLGLVRVESANPFDLGKNHQVLAYGYQILDRTVAFRLYDPNLPSRDDVTLSVNMADARRPARAALSPPGGAPVFAYFRTPYSRVEPPRRKRA